MDTVCEWGTEFMKTPYFGALTEEQKERAESVLLSITETMYSDHGLPPEKWNVSALEEICLHRMPQIMIADESYFESIAPVLSAFFLFLAERNLVKNAPALAKKIKRIDRQIVKNSQNPNNWNAGKHFFMDAVKAGVDITNEKEVNAYLEKTRKKAIEDGILGKLF